MFVFEMIVAVDGFFVFIPFIVINKNFISEYY